MMADDFVRSPVYNAVGGIDCEINHPAMGWIPFTASPDDPEPHGRAVYAQALAMGPAPYVEPEPQTPALPVLTRRQLRLGLLANGITTAQVEAVIAAIPDEIDRETAQIEWADASQYERTHPLVDQIGVAMSLTPAQIDNMWTAASSL